MPDPLTKFVHNYAIDGHKERKWPQTPIPAFVTMHKYPNGGSDRFTPAEARALAAALNAAADEAEGRLKA